MKRLLLLVLLTGCPKPTGPVANPRRCEVDLKATGLFAQGGTGVSARRIDDASQLIGGPNAQGRLGDVLLQNDKVRVIIEQPGRSVGPALSGGHLIDADLKGQEVQSANSGRRAGGRGRGGRPQVRCREVRGLGLALVKRIAVAHGGTAWAQHREGGGARVGFSVKRAA